MIIMVGAGGILGATVRYAIDRYARKKWPVRIPWGIVVCNLGGSFLLGILTGSMMSESTRSFLGVGFCGALTTYSTFAYDVVSLTEKGKIDSAAYYVLINMIAGCVLAAVGYFLGNVLTC